MAKTALQVHGLNVRLVCRIFGISETCYRYQPKLSDENAEIADWLIRITHNPKNWGFGLCFLFLRNVKGYPWNHKRVYRIYRELELNLRIKPKKHIVREKLFNVIDDFNREGLTIDVDFSLPAERVVRALDRVIEWRGKPAVLRCDNGPEYVSKTLELWAKERDIHLEFIQPGNLQQNAYIERYNRTVRYDWLNQYLFESIQEVQDYATRWLWTYNHERPNTAIGGITPKQKLAMVA